MRVCGVDDAGRGSMLGPLVIAGFAIGRSKLRRLADLGVRDSKQLSPRRREELYCELVRLADSYQILRIPVRSIDASVRRHGLNALEAKYMARAVSRLGPDVSYVDSCDVNPARFGAEVSRLSGGGRVRSYHRADSRFAVVSAASILAKVARDRAVARLGDRSEIGSGYPSDRRTVGFVRRYHARNGDLPPFVRKSWKPARRLLESAG